MIRRSPLLFLLLFATPPAASAIDGNVLFGFGAVGPAQFDQGEVKLMATANATGFLRVGDSVSFGGVGLAVRATHGVDRFFERGNFDELGLSVPFVTYRRNRLVAQLGVEIQRANLQKNLYYLAFGIGFGGRTKPLAPAAVAGFEGENRSTGR